jgi:hypothetical protein
MTIAYSLDLYPGAFEFIFSLVGQACGLTWFPLLGSQAGGRQWVGGEAWVDLRKVVVQTKYQGAP